MRIGISSVTSHSHIIDDEPLYSTTVEKDLGVVVNENLKFHQHAAAVATKANHTLERIGKCFEHLDVDSLPIFYKTLVRPRIYKFCLGPHYILYRSENVKKIQKRATRLVTIFVRIAIC